jgi:hypothetical protein
MRRFVFLLAGGPEVIDGSDVEIRAEVQIDAEHRASELESLYGCTARLIGMREGFSSTARFLPLVPVTELPSHILQNEKFPPSVCDARCDELFRRQQEVA